MAQKVSYLKKSTYICGVMKENGFHHTKTKPNKKLLPLKFKKWKNLSQVFVI